jgi:hypothetical protein
MVLLVVGRNSFCFYFKDRCWKNYSVPERVLCNVRHNCSGTYQKPITVVDLKGLVCLTSLYCRHLKTCISQLHQSITDRYIAPKFLTASSIVLSLCNTRWCTIQQFNILVKNEDWYLVVEECRCLLLTQIL